MPGKAPYHLYSRSGKYSIDFHCYVNTHIVYVHMCTDLLNSKRIARHYTCMKEGRGRGKHVANGGRQNIYWLASVVILLFQL